MSSRCRHLLRKSRDVGKAMRVAREKKFHRQRARLRRRRRSWTAPLQRTAAFTTVDGIQLGDAVPHLDAAHAGCLRDALEVRIIEELETPQNDPRLRRENAELVVRARPPTREDR